jgi:hypothetical protein
VTDQSSTPINRFRVFMVDATSYDFYLGPNQSWESFLAQLTSTGCMMTNDIMIMRDSIVKIMRIYDGPAAPIGNVIPFPEPKGTA